MKRRLKVFFLLLLISAVIAGCKKTNTQEQSTAVATQTTVGSEVRPDMTFELTLDGVSYPQDAAEIRTSSISAEALEQLSQMTGLKLVTATEGTGENLEQLRTYCDEKGIVFQVELAGQTVDGDTEELTLSNATENQVQLLGLMPNLKSLHFPEPEAPAEALLELRTKLPETVVTWEKTVLGMTFPQNAVEIDLSKVIALSEGQSFGEKTAYEYGLEFQTMGTQEEPRRTAKILPAHPLVNKREETTQLIKEVEQAMSYFPDAEKVLMCGAILDDEAMTQFRESHRQDYKVVWSVICGDMAVQTDATFFMPTKYYVQSGGFSDLNAYNLRYCEDMVSIDFGHMNITMLDFAEYMPNLKYLVLTFSHVKDLSPLSACKNLVFLEMHWCDRVEDYSPLLECTALEDLNVGGTLGDITPILEMTWLKNLWLVSSPEENYQKALAAMPDTNIAYYYGNPDDGWRELPNYYKMRDALLMFYME